MNEETTVVAERPALEPATHERRVARVVAEIALLVVLAFAFAQFIKAFLVQPFVIPTGSMISTIQIGDRVLADKLVYRLGHEPVVGERGVLEQVGPDLGRLHDRLIAAPARDAAVVAAPQHLRDLHAAEERRTRVLRVLEETFREGLVHTRFTIAEHPGQQPRHGVDDEHRGKLAAGHDEVTHGQLEIG